MAGQLGHRRNSDLWARVAAIVEAGPPPVLLTRDVVEPRAYQKQVRLPAAQVQRLIADYEAGATVSNVARFYGVSLTTATKHLADNGVSIRPNKVAISTNDHPALLEFKAQGLNNVQLAEHFGCSRQAVQQALGRALRFETLPGNVDEDPR